MTNSLKPPPILVLPGLGGSSASHWQSHWAAKYPNCTKVEQANWNIPDPKSWIRTLNDAVNACSTPPLLVAHSLSCALVAHWAQQNHHTPIKGALLVAPADVESEDHTPMEVRCFAPMPLKPLPFPSIVLASSNDPYVDPQRAKLFATAWGADFVNMGALGHINADSHLGDWDDGWAHLDDLNDVVDESRRA